MEASLFNNPKRFFVLTVFIERTDLERRIKEFEALGRNRNLKLVVQPCPYEGIEFLYRVGDGLIGHYVSLEKDLFWEAIEIKKDTPKQVQDEISAHHLNYLVAILEQDPIKVKREVLKLKELEEHFVKPLEGGSK